MKRKSNIITFVLAVALLGSSCTSVITEAPTDETQAISFQTPKTRTRAAIDDATDMTDGFSVWGWYRKTDAGPHNVFDGVTVRLDNGSWIYDDTRYWIPGWTYDFYAVHPVFPDGGPTANVTPDGTISVTNFDCSKTGAQAIDLMTARNTGITYNGGDTPPAPVDLKFGHELAKLNFVVKSENTIATITGFKVYGVDYKGKLSKNSTTATWTDQVPCTETDTPFSITQDLVLNNTDGWERNVFGDLLLIPDNDLTGAYLKIEYMYPGETTVRISEVGLKTVQTPTWEAGKNYKYSLTIEGGSLTINVTVIDWTEKDTSVSWG